MVQIQGQVQESIERLVVNQDELKQLQSQADKMAENAAEFQKNSKKVERIMWWRKTKIQIFIAVGIIAVIILILVLVKFT